jgi:hypothetical protein
MTLSRVTLAMIEAAAMLAELAISDATEPTPDREADPDDDDRHAGAARRSAEE